MKFWTNYIVDSITKYEHIKEVARDFRENQSRILMEAFFTFLMGIIVIAIISDFIILIMLSGCFYFLFNEDVIFKQNLTNQSSVYKNYSFMTFVNYWIASAMKFFSFSEMELDFSIKERLYMFGEKDKSFDEMLNYDYEELIKYGIKTYLELYFARREPTLIKFFEQRIKNHYGNIQSNFIFYSLAVPHRDIISVDALKTILLNNQFPPNEQFIIPDFDIEWLLGNNHKINKMFFNYEEQDLKKIFGKYYNYKDYLKILELSAKHDLELPLMNSIDELSKYLTEIDTQVKDGIYELKQEELYSNISNLKGVFFLHKDKYEFYIMQTMNDLYSWGNALKNCLECDSRRYKNVIQSRKGMLLGIYKNNKKYAAICIDEKGGVTDLRRKFNLELSTEETSLILQQFSKKYNNR